MPVRDFCQLWLCQFPYVSARAPYSTLEGHTRAPYRPHRIWKTLKIPVGGPYDARTGPCLDVTVALDGIFIHINTVPWHCLSVEIHAYLRPFQIKFGPNTVGGYYNTVHYKMKFYTAHSFPKSECVFTNDAPYLTLTGELWVFIVRIFKKIHCIQGEL